VGLTDDQKAMLRLLAQREEGYDDMAALMGISVEEVRERVREALAEVDEPDEAPAAASKSQPAPSPPVPPEPESPEPAASPPRHEESPQAEEPSKAPPAPAPAAGAPAEPSKPAEPRRAPRLKLPKDRGALIGLGAGALAVFVLAIVLIVSGGESNSGSSPTAGETSLAENTAAAAEGEDLTQAILSPIAGGDASGRALFGRYRKNVLLQVEADGLEPSPQGQTYTIWLYRTPKLALQIGSVPVGGSGKIAAQFKIPAQLLAYVASGAFNQVDVSLTSTAAYRAALTKAKAARKLPPHVGTSVLRGEITGPAIKRAGSAE
jgi:hypothetical protein